MNRLLHVVLTLCAAAASMAEAGDLRIDSASPAATVVRHFGWLEAGVAGRGTTVQWAADGKLDFASADGAAALKARAAGGALKAVYVLWRDAAGNDQYLLASEELLSKNAPEAQAVIAAFERARRWITANPDEAAKVLAPGALMRNLTGSRPGPAQLAALGSTAKALGIDQKIAAQLLDDSLVRAAIVGAVRTPAEGGLNW